MIRMYIISITICLHGRRINLNFYYHAKWAKHEQVKKIPRRWKRILCIQTGELIKRQSNAPVITAKESCRPHKLAVPQKRKRRAVNFPRATAKNNRNLLAIEGSDEVYFIASAPKGAWAGGRREMKSVARPWLPGTQQWKQKRWESALAIIWLGCQLEFHFLTEQGFARFTVVISLWKRAMFALTMQ